MADSRSNKRLLAELRRRRVLPIAGAYVAIAWLATEIAGFLLQQASAPDWTLRLLAIIFVVGFPVTVFLAWVIQVGPEGKRIIDSSQGQHRTVIAALALGILVTAGLSWLILPRLDEGPAALDYQPLPNSIGVLPFEVPGGTPNALALSETFHTALIKGLDQSPELTLIALPLKEPPDDLATFGRSVRVQALLHGGMTQTAGGGRIDLEFLDVGNNAVYWTESYDLDPSRIMELGAEIANRALASLNLPPVTSKRFAGTDNREAYAAFLEGSRRPDQVDALLLAFEDFERAIALDPDYVLAHVALADAINWFLFLNGPPEEERLAWEARARQALETALELDPDSAAATSTLGRLTEDREIKLRLYRHALALDPQHALTYARLGNELRVENPEEAARLLRAAIDLEPLNSDHRRRLGSILLAKGDHALGVAQLEKAIDLDPANDSAYRDLGAYFYYQAGRLDQSIYYMRKAHSVNPKSGYLAGFVAGGYAELGMETEAIAWIDHALQISPTALWAWDVAAIVYTRLGDEETGEEYNRRAMELLENDEFMKGTGRYDWRIAFEGAKTDIDEGRIEEGLNRYRDAFPLETGEAFEIDASTLGISCVFAGLLKDAGYEQEARLRFKRCADFADSICATADDHEMCRHVWQIYSEIDDREKTLRALRWHIVDLGDRTENWELGESNLDFLRDDPEFLELMQILQNDLAAQRARVSEMERNGGMPPAPALDLETPEE